MNDFQEDLVPVEVGVSHCHGIRVAQVSLVHVLEFLYLVVLALEEETVDAHVNVNEMDYNELEI